jgi:TPR repeat protein
VPARLALGVVQFNSEDFRAAFAQFEQAANAGLVSAQFNLASMYELGIGIESDRKQAVRWYTEASAGGLDSATEALARLNKTEPPDIDSPSAVYGSNWVLDQNADHYTLQVATGGSEAATVDILERYGTKIVRAYFLFDETDNPRYLALIGSFPSYLDAIAFLNSLDPELRVDNPWIRRFGSIHALAGDQNKT